MIQTHALVIDDNATNVKVLAALLAKQGVRTTEVTDPRALAALLPTLAPVDVVFLDLEMPGLDGYEVLRILRRRLGATHIIACTVHTNEIALAKQIGFDGFVGKPLDGTRFPEQLARILSGEGVWERG